MSAIGGNRRRNVGGVVGGVLVLLGLLAVTAPLGIAAPDRVSELHRRAVAHYERGEYQEALPLFREALGLAPDEPAIRVSLGRTHVAIAARMLEESGPHDPRALEHASQQLRQALLHWEGDAATHELIAFCALRQGRLEPAESALETAVERDPRAARAWNLLGVVRDRRGRLGPAIDALERALALRPGDAGIERRLRRLRFDRETIENGRPVASARFRVFVPPSIPVERARAVLARLDATSEELEKRWGGDAPENVEAILYPPGEFSRRTGFAEEVGGAFDGRIRIAFPEELNEGGLALDQVIRHETAHLFLHRLPGPLPRWLDEGLAQWVDGGARDDWRERFLAAGGAGAESGLEAREAAVASDGPGTITPAHWAALYLHSYLLLRHLEETHGRFRVDLIVRRLARGGGVEATFTEVLGETPVVLDRAWRRSLREARSGEDEADGEGDAPADGEGRSGGGVKKVIDDRRSSRSSPPPPGASGPPVTGDPQWRTPSRRMRPSSCARSRTTRSRRGSSSSPGPRSSPS